MFWKSLSSILTVEVISASPEGILEAVMQKKIPLFRVEQRDELTFRMEIRRRDYQSLCGILRRRGAAFRVLRISGIYWTAKNMLRRPVLGMTFLCLLMLSFYLPTRVLFVTVEGNSAIPQRQILSAAEQCGIRFGASRKQVRSEQVKNELLSAVPRLQWAGVNTSGCTAVISVRERTEDDRQEDTGVVSSIIANRDGYILSATATGGTLAVQPGETVTRGQLLISGFTDCGFCIRASRAEGEILAQTNRNLRAVMVESSGNPTLSPETRYKISLLIGKKRINLWKDSRISTTGCGRMYEEYYVSLPGGFRLPVGIAVDRYRDYTLKKAILPQKQAQMLLRQFSEGYTERQMNGGRILQARHDFAASGGIYRLDSRYVCEEFIGRERREQIGDINEQGN